MLLESYEGGALLLFDKIESNEGYDQTLELFKTFLKDNGLEFLLPELNTELLAVGILSITESLEPTQVETIKKFPHLREKRKTNAYWSGAISSDS